MIDMDWLPFFMNLLKVLEDINYGKGKTASSVRLDL